MGPPLPWALKPSSVSPTDGTRIDIRPGEQGTCFNTELHFKSSYLIINWSFIELPILVSALQSSCAAGILGDIIPS